LTNVEPEPLIFRAPLPQPMPPNRTRNASPNKAPFEVRITVVLLDELPFAFHPPQQDGILP